MLTPFNTATYHSLQTKLDRRLSKDLLFGTVYTFSKAINYADQSDSGLTFNWGQSWRATAP
jgi:hypothetical protein